MSALNILLSLILYLILVILVIILLVTVLPLSISFFSNVDGLIYDAFVNFSILLGAFQGSVIFNPQGGAFKLRLFWLTVHSRTLNETVEPKKEPKKPERKRRGSPRKMLGPLRRLLSDLVRVIRIKRLDADLTVGLSDPYILGLMFGAAYPVAEMSRLFLSPLSISLTPDFKEEKFKSTLDSSISLRIILLVIPLIRFFVSRGFREYRRP